MQESITITNKRNYVEEVVVSDVRMEKLKLIKLIQSQRCASTQKHF